MRSQIGMGVLVFTLIACGQGLGGQREYCEPPQQGFLQRLHPVGGWHPYGGGLLFYVAGSSPVSLEFVSSGRYVSSGKPPYGLELQAQVPAIATVPGAPLASTRTIDVKVGAAIKQGRRLISYGTMPSKCPRGGFPMKAELTFGGSFGGATMIPRPH